MEIERKFLIEMPRLTTLFANGAIKLAIEQCYLPNESNMQVRARKIESLQDVKYYLTKKSTEDGISREEIEGEISAEEYFTLVQKSTMHIEKSRYVINLENHVLEVDEYQDNWLNALLEIEIQSEDEEISLPDYISIIKEVTNDPYYRNYNIAKRGTL